MSSWVLLTIKLWYAPVFEQSRYVLRIIWWHKTMSSIHISPKSKQASTMDQFSIQQSSSWTGPSTSIRPKKTKEHEVSNQQIIALSAQLEKLKGGLKLSDQLWSKLKAAVNEKKARLVHAKTSGTKSVNKIVNGSLMHGSLLSPSPTNQKKTSMVRHFGGAPIITPMACDAAINQQWRNAMSSSKNNKIKKQTWLKSQLMTSSRTTIQPILQMTIISSTATESKTNSWTLLTPTFK